MPEYEDFVKELNKQALDPYTTIDERLDFIGPRVIDTLNRIRRVEVSMGIGENIEQLAFAYNLAIAGLPGSGVTLVTKAPFDGYIRRVSIHWPDGCDALVDVKVGKGVTAFCPREGFLALNDATPVYPFNIEIKEGEEIWVELQNTDGANPHNVTVTVDLEEAP